jgi:hypothetical protein
MIPRWIKERMFRVEVLKASHIHENITSGLKKELGLIIDGQPSLEQQFHRVPTTEKPQSLSSGY